MTKYTFKRGLHIHHADNMKNLSLKNNTIKKLNPKVIHLPIGQHIGAPAECLVKKGDNVLAGQLIAKANGNFSANIHSPISGIIMDIKDMPEPTGKFSPTVIIENDMQNKWVDTTERGEIEVKSLSRQDILNIITEKGIVGLGGATFPTHIKYQGDIECDYVLLNGIECEPYNTADYVTMLNHQNDILKGLVELIKASNAKKGFICIEDNKMDIYNAFIAKSKYYANIEVLLFKEKYPQGAEKQMISAALKKEVPSGKLPINIKTIVNNVGTAKAVYDAVYLDKPLTHHYLTISGDKCKHPQNLFVPVGTLFKDVIEIAETKDNDFNLIAGGIMMGKMMLSVETPVTKGINALLLVKSTRRKAGPCIKCSKCITHCPAFLSPTTLAKLSKLNMSEELVPEGVLDCIECGSCSYVCPSNIPLLDYIRDGKNMVRRKKS